jgi:hypothetical protein
VFSEETKIIFRKNGWAPGRNIDITKFTEYLKNEVYVVSEIVRDFLK